MKDHSYAEIGAFVKELQSSGEYKRASRIIDSVFEQMTDEPYGDIIFDQWCNEFDIEI